MLKKGFIGQIIFLLIIAATVVFGKNYFSKYPGQNSLQIARSILVYPNASSWEISENKQLCIYYFNKCSQVPAVITFKTVSFWPDIYDYYKQKLLASGWQTESHIITSIPTSIIFTNNNYFKNVNCQVLIKEKNNTFLGLLEDKNTQLFTITAECSPR